jgi:cytochrome c553
VSGSILASLSVMRLLLVFLAGCNVLAAPSDLVDKVRDARVRMHKRFEASERMQQALAVGRLEQARSEARLIDQLKEPDALPEWREHIDRIREAARKVATAEDTVSAARSSAALGRQCARCHEAGATRVAFAKLPDSKHATQMASHGWAAARMWEGLIGPDDGRWLLGARQLAEAKITITAESGSLGIADDVSRVRLLAKRAIKPQSQDERSLLYGDLLATCAHCHFVIRD